MYGFSITKTVDTLFVCDHKHGTSRCTHSDNDASNQYSKWLVNDKAAKSIH